MPILNVGDKVVVTIPRIFRTVSVTAFVVDAPESDRDTVRIVPLKRALAARWICVSAQYVNHA